MAFDERLAQRIRTSLGSRANITEKHLFGGLAFMLDGKMFCGILGEDLMVRVGPETYDLCLALPHVSVMRAWAASSRWRGRAMKPIRS